ncbi:MAG: hypothetical protein OWQ57_03965 [Sulfobacillus sp.]|nr:hypothetical protein [Sulfobacillus sp.]
MSCGNDGCLTIRAAIAVLQEGCPTSPVVTWWHTTGRHLRFDVPNTLPTAKDRRMAGQRFAYLRAVLQDAIATRDVADIEYVITRWVSDLEAMRAYPGAET